MSLTNIFPGLLDFGEKTLAWSFIFYFSVRLGIWASFVSYKYHMDRADWNRREELARLDPGEGCGRSVWVGRLGGGTRRIHGWRQSEQALKKPEVGRGAGRWGDLDPSAGEVRHWRRTWAIWLSGEVTCNMRGPTDGDTGPTEAQCSQQAPYILRCQQTPDPTPSEPTNFFKLFFGQPSFSLTWSISNMHTCEIYI